MSGNEVNLLKEFVVHAEAASFFRQAGVMALIMLAAWWLGALVQKALRYRFQDVAQLAGIPFTAFSLLGMMLAHVIFRQLGSSANLISLAIPLLLSLLIIRFLVYLLRNVFPGSARLKFWERSIAVVMWVGVALHVTGLLDVVLASLSELSFNLGREQVSLLLILQGLISIVATVLTALWIGRFLEVRIMRMEELDTSSRVLLTKVVRGALLVMSVLVALSIVGIDIRVLSVFGGALGVGLGFGLQRIASNYICGFILLLDKSIRLDDVITLDNHYGTVTRLTGRYMVLRGQDGAESLIPNETAITSTLVNHSFSDRNVRIKTGVQISYRSDLGKAMQIMLDAASAQSQVLSDPAPVVNLLEFAENGIALELQIWIADPELAQASLRSDINLSIWREFQKFGIEIPFPQREVRMISD